MKGEEYAMQTACAYTSSLCCLIDLILQDIIKNKVLDTDSVMMIHLDGRNHLSDMLKRAEELIEEMQRRSPMTCNSAAFWAAKLLICLFQLRAQAESMHTVDHLSITKKIMNDATNIASKTLTDLAILCKSCGAFDSAKCLFNKVVQIQCSKHIPDLHAVAQILIESIKMSKCNEESLSFLDTAYHLCQAQNTDSRKKGFPTASMHYLGIVLWNIVRITNFILCDAFIE
mmetsp:Transcript_12389/g.14067  ORF Transcript_12389/g.14067 Transcript_12389/m.14067 type:complete len:229 (-) Transcript_12389:35-721(-)